jgi:hypothetical protein
MRHAPRLAALAVAGALALTACGSDDGGSDETTATTGAPAATEAPAATDAAATTTDTPAATNAAATGTVDANNATIAELQAAFEAAGISNADKWAREVDEYRPYSDPTFADLREELAKYGPTEETVDAIIAVLSI